MCARLLVGTTNAAAGRLLRHVLLGSPSGDKFISKCARYGDVVDDDNGALGFQCSTSWLLVADGDGDGFCAYYASVHVPHGLYAPVVVVR